MYARKCLSFSGAQYALDTVESQYDAITEQQHAEKEYREARKASRGRWRGGGFGLGGALKGAATAGALNAVSGFGHDLVNSAGNLSSALDASNAKSDLYKSANAVLLNGLYEDMRTFFDNHIQLLTTAKPGYFKFCFDEERANALFTNAKQLPDKRAELLEQAFELNQKRTNQIIGGMLWMKMGDHRIQTAIDLSGLGLDTIEEDETQFSIGCMTSLRQLELHEGLNQWSDGAVRESVRHIVGVQFRNLATVGGSIFGRFGFSDVLTCFLAMDTYVELHHSGILSLADFVNLPRDNDILIRLIVKKTPGKCVYLSQRNTKTDFPVLTCAVCRDERGIRVAVGARPQKAMLLTLSETQNVDLAQNRADAAAKIADELAAQIPTQDNMRASAAYRTHLAKVLIRRALLTVTEEVQ